MYGGVSDVDAWMRKWCLSPKGQYHTVITGVMLSFRGRWDFISTCCCANLALKMMGTWKTTKYYGRSSWKPHWHCHFGPSNTTITASRISPVKHVGPVRFTLVQANMFKTVGKHLRLLEEQTSNKLRTPEQFTKTTWSSHLTLDDVLSTPWKLSSVIFMAVLVPCLTPSMRRICRTEDLNVFEVVRGEIRKGPVKNEGKQH